MATYDFHLRCPIAQMIISFSCRSCLKAEQASCHARTLPINNISFFFLDRLLRTSGNLRPGGERGQLTIERQTGDLCRIALSTCGSLDVQYIVQHAAISKFLPVALKPTTNKKSYDFQMTFRLLQHHFSWKELRSSSCLFDWPLRTFTEAPPLQTFGNVEFGKPHFFPLNHCWVVGW